jgi:methyl-accepting chemotaxis protein
MKFENISFKKKIYILLTIPLLGFLFSSVSSMLQDFAKTQEMSQLARSTKLSTVYSDLVHELQKERGMTAGFLGSKGTKFASKLQAQRANANDKSSVKNEYWRDNAFESSKINALNSAINQQLSQIDTIRNQIDQQSISTAEAISFYTETNALLLSVSTLISEISTDTKVSKEVVAYYNFIQGKERAGIERAVLSNTFSANKFNEGMLVKFIKLVSEQNTYMSSFAAFSSNKNKTFYHKQIDNPAIIEVQRLRDVALAKATEGNFGVDASHWFEQSTKRIGLFKTTESQLSNSLLSLVERKSDDAFNAMIINTLISSTLIIISLLLSGFIIKELSMQVEDLTFVMNKVRDEDDLTIRAKHICESEMGQIALALNLTLEKFSGAMDEISTSSTTLASAAEETSQTCEYNSQSMLAQQDEIGLIATAIEELSATVKEVAGNTQLAADSAKEADTQAQGGLEVVQKSYHSIEELASEIADLATRITSLHESSNNITNVVDVIKSVAEQTNLLALNAAIEAARAGEQGRGFAVVADEVRTLAQRTQQSTSEIENFISSLQTDANAAFSVIETSQNMAEKAVTNSKNVEETLSGITSSVSNIFAMTEQVAVAVEEQAMVTQDVAKNVVSVEQKSMESTTGATQIATTAREQANLATTLQDISIVFKI